MSFDKLYNDRYLAYIMLIFSFWNILSVCINHTVILLSLIYIRCSMIVFFNFLLQLSSGKNKAYLEVLSFGIDKCKCNTINQNMLFVMSKIDRIAQR